MDLCKKHEIILMAYYELPAIQAMILLCETQEKFHHILQCVEYNFLAFFVQVLVSVHVDYTDNSQISHLYHQMLHNRVLSYLILVRKTYISIVPKLN